MQVEHVAPILTSAFEMLESAGASPRRGGLSALGQMAPVAWELVGLVTVAGDLQGAVLCGLSRATAARLRPALDLGAAADDSQTAAELARRLCDGGLTRLWDAGVNCTVSAPVSLADCDRLPGQAGEPLIAAIETTFGVLEVGVSLQRSGTATVQAREDAA